jgi:hypothetical protein
MSNRRLPFDPHEEFARLEVIKGELQDRYDATASDTEDVVLAQLATAIANIIRAQSALLYETMTRGWVAGDAVRAASSTGKANGGGDRAR